MHTNTAAPWDFATAVGAVTRAVFSYVGCLCNSGCDNIYSVDDAGRQVLCPASVVASQFQKQQHRPSPAYTGLLEMSVSKSFSLLCPMSTTG